MVGHGLYRTARHQESQQAAALCGGRVDAIAFVAANPVPVVQEATFSCAARLLPLDQKFTNMIIEHHPYYVPATVPGGVYPNNPQSTPTIGVRGVVVASVATPDELAYEVTRTVFKNVAELVPCISLLPMSLPTRCSISACSRRSIRVPRGTTGRPA